MIFLEKKRNNRIKSNARSRKHTKSKPVKTVEGRKQEIIGIVFITVAIISACGLFGLNVGFIGVYFANFLKYFLGVGAFVAVIAALAQGLFLVIKHKGFTPSLQSGAFAAFYIFCLAIYHHWTIPVGEEILPSSLAPGGGLAGGLVLFVVRKCFGVDGSIIVLCTGALLSLLLATKWSLANGIKKTGEGAQIGIDAAHKAIEATYDKIHSKSITEAEKPEKSRADFYDQEKDSMFGDAVETQHDLPQNSDDEYMAYLKQNDNMGAIKTADAPRNVSVFNPFEANDTEQENVQQSVEMDESTNPLAATSEDHHEVFKDEIFVNDKENIETVVTDEPVDIKPVETSSQPFPIEYSSDNSGVSDAQYLSEIDDDFDDAKHYLDEVSADSFEPQDRQMSDVTEPKLDEPNYGANHDSAPSNVEDADDANVADNVVDGVPNETAIPQQPDYQLPVVTEILQKNRRSQNYALQQEISENAQILSKTLENFKVKAKIVNACHGPAVTRYELEPAPGVKVSKITNLSDDIALALAASSVRIEPIQGKAAIGIEVPNKELESVGLRDVLENSEFSSAKSKLTVGLGIDIGGKAIFADIAKMPHLLVAGATGSGKSVCINTIIASILFKARPDEVKFILIDPKMVELSNYNGIPHLMVPVVTDAKKAASVLNWAVQEMEKRYTKFAETGVRNMEGYNQKVAADERIPSIVLIIDELADLMMVAPHDVEDAICRIAQKARAAGMHLILATQRPSVDVITGIIKANIPSRISFAVSSQIDSRTILDMSGAEKLLGKGDMLFAPVGTLKPIRVQGAFVGDDEVERLLDFIRAQGHEAIPDEEIISFTENEAEEKEEKTEKKHTPKVDELLGDAVELVLTSGQASTSSIQRRFRIGYTRAGRLVDIMESLHIVGPSNGSKPREILMTREEAMDALKNIE